jgi:UDP-N-acetylglucosamine 2-epimerase
VERVGSDPETFLNAAGKLWGDIHFYDAMAKPRFPFGDGHASEKIVNVLTAEASNGAFR